MLKFLLILCGGFMVVSKLTDWIFDVFGIIPAVLFFIAVSIAVGIFFGIGAMVRYTGWDPTPKKRRR